MSETHYNCGGQLKAKEYQNEWRCQRCEATVRDSVVSRQARFKRVAAGDGPLSDIAKAALEGVHD